VLTGGIRSDVIDTGNDTAADRVVASDQSADRITCAPPDQVAADALDVRLG
jgi:hypothetical protein